MRSPAPVAAIAVGLLFVAGCTTTIRFGATAEPAPGTGGVPRPPASSPVPNAANDFGAPSVTTSLNTARYQQNPCAALTTGQMRTIGITVTGYVASDPQGNICHWSPFPDTDYAFGFTTVFPDGQVHGLANAYEVAGPGEMRRLPDVDGQPAATEPDQNTDGNCTIYLGATDQIEYAATVLIGQGRPDYSNPCSLAQQIADDTTATMKSNG